MTFIELPILIFLLFGVIIRVFPHSAKTTIKIFSIAGAIFSLFYGIYNFISPFNISFSTIFKYTVFSGLIALGIAFFGFIIIIFSVKYADFIKLLNKYYSYIFFSVGFSIATVYSSNLITLLVFWGLQGLTLYLLLNLLPGASNASKKSYAFIGGSDAVMILGIAILWMLTNSLDIYNIKIVLGKSLLPTVSFLCLTIAALTKAGAVPFHTWVPDFAKHAPISLTAFFPASIDKLLGIFLLVLVCNQLFVLNAAMIYLLMAIGAITIVSAASAAIVQHDLKELLSYHAVSQVGYMILGIATCTPLGIAAGIFHLINHAIYKSGLLLVASSVEYSTGKTNLDQLGGLSRFMPVTFVVCLITALSISGIPPLNGFVSKWMIYLSLIQRIDSINTTMFSKYATLLVLVFAMFGSALTLASFIKLIHSVFLGQPTENRDISKNSYKEVGFLMLLPMSILAFLCVIFGIFPYILPLKQLVFPGLATFGIKLTSIPGIWRPDLATGFILFGILLGLLTYLFTKIKYRKSEAFMGGEKLPLEAMFPGTHFYRNLSDMKGLRKIFIWAQNRLFDIYNLGTETSLRLGRMLSSFHTGSLQLYLTLFLIGLVGIAIVYIGGSVF